MKNMLIVFMLAMTLMFITSCNGSNDEASNFSGSMVSSLETSDEVSFDETLDEVAPPNEGVAVFEFAVLNFDDINVENPEYIHFVDKTALGQNWKIVVSVSENINVFSLIELDEAVALKVGDTLYVHDAWKYDIPLMLHTYINDTTHNRGISYTDGNGKVVYLAFSCDMNTGDVGLSEINIGVIPNGSYEPDITDTKYKWENNDVFSQYFDDYVRDDERISWTHIGVSEGQYTVLDNEAYTQFDIYRVVLKGEQWVEYYAIPYSDTQIETVYKFQFDDSLVPIWIKP